MKRKIAAAVVLVAVLGGAAACAFLRHWTTWIKSADAGLPVVFVEKVKAGGCSEKAVLAGKIAPLEEVQMAAKISGRVSSVAGRVGDRVKKGDVLVSLEAKELAAALDQAEAGLQAVRAQESQARLDLDRARAALEQARVNFQIAEDNLKRGEFLLDQGAVSQANFDSQFKAPYVNAKGALDQAQAAYEIAQDRLSRQLPAQVRQAEAAVAMAKANTENSAIISPVDGVISWRGIDPGELAAPGVPLLTVVDIDRVYVEAWATESQLGLLRKGMKVDVRVPALGDRVFPGVVKEISPAADAKTKNFFVRFEVDNRSMLLKPGMFAEAVLGSEEKGLLVPLSALIRDAEGCRVYVYSNGKVRLRDVDVSGEKGGYALVKGGLKQGELVVTSGTGGLRDGMAVKASRAV